MDVLKNYFMVNENNILLNTSVLKDYFLVNENNTLLNGRVERLYPD